MKHGHKLEHVLAAVRPAVRRTWAYRVGGAENILVKLNQNESPFDFPDALKKELVEAYLSAPFNRYPNIQPGQLQKALAARLDWDEDGVLVGNGSNELCAAAVAAIVERGTPVVLPRPMFGYFVALARLFDGSVHEVSPRSDLSFDAAALLAAVREVKPALTILTTPNNPTGMSMPIEEIEPIVAASAGIVVVDEAYLEFTEETSAFTILERYPNLLLLRTFSKAYGLAGLRVGYLVGHKTLIAEISKARPPFMTDRLAELTALKLLENPELTQERINYIKRETKRLERSLASMDFVEPLPTQSNFVTFTTPIDATELMDRLAARGVMVRNMSGYRELKGYLRVSAGLESENNIFLVELKAALKNGSMTPTSLP